MFIEKDQECWTAEANSKTESVLRRSSTALYEKEGKCLFYYETSTMSSYMILFYLRYCYCSHFREEASFQVDQILQ